MHIYVKNVVLFSPQHYDAPLPRCLPHFSFPVTGNRCKHVGYDEFEPPSWNSDCAPDTEKWIDRNMSTCGVGQSYPEEFWGCSDIALTPSETSSFGRLCWELCM